MAKFADYISNTADLYFANFVQFFLAMLLVMILFIVGVFVVVFVMKINYIIGFILSLIMILVMLPLFASFYGMAAEAVKTGKTSLGTLFSTFKEKWMLILGIEIASVVIILIPGLAAIVLTSVISLLSLVLESLELLSILVAILAILATVVLSILLLLAIPSAVCDNTGIEQSIRKSFAVVNSNPGSLVAIWLFYSIVGAVISAIPLIGTLIYLFVISPMTCIAFTDFYLKNKTKKTAGASAKNTKKTAKTAAKPKAKNLA